VAEVKWLDHCQERNIRIIRSLYVTQLEPSKASLVMAIQLVLMMKGVSEALRK
jgi:hypothetical protein